MLKGLTWAQIAADLHDPSSPVAKAVLGTANYMTAAICELTGDQPASACTVGTSLQALQGRERSNSRDQSSQVHSGYPEVSLSSQRT